MELGLERVRGFRSRPGNLMDQAANAILYSSGLVADRVRQALVSFWVPCVWMQKD